MFLTKNIRLASNIAKNNQNISILGEIYNFTEFINKYSQNSSILITLVESIEKVMWTKFPKKDLKNI